VTKRLALAVAVAVLAVVAPAVASADPIALCNGQPCVKGHWYTSTVSVSWNLNGETNLAGCASQTYKQDTDQSNLTPVTPNLPPWTYCTTDVATRYAFITVEISSPTATVAASRPPDSSGWYNHPLDATVAAIAFSGVASCTPTTYAGPDSATATLSATCVDNAGKGVNVTSAPFAYDATPPTLTASATTGDRTVQLSWQTSSDLDPLASVTVTRSPGGGTVYSGNATGYTDTKVSDGIAYRYTITAIDVAGNAATQSVVATPAARLLQPVANANVMKSPPPTLTWTPIRRATYYNVQLYHGGGQVLSMWPARASLELPRKWRFKGHTYRLKPGVYRWFVWPGFGKRSAARYGHRIGAGTFVVR
jgi:hypothetical protein